MSDESKQRREHGQPGSPGRPAPQQEGRTSGESGRESVRDASNPTDAALEPARPAQELPQPDKPGRKSRIGLRPAKTKALAEHGMLEIGVPDESVSVPIEREEFLMIREPRGQVAEQFRGLRNSIHALNPDGASHSLIVASAVRGEGKTVACINLAVAMAELPGQHVLLIDADLHHPCVETYLGMPLRQGLSEVLSGKLPIDRAIRQTSATGVSVMGAGEPPPNPTELLGSDRMRSILNRLKQSYSYVLIDTPAGLNISDASLLGAMADGVLMVVRLGETPRQYVQQTLNMLEGLGGNILGTCLTGAKVKDASRGYRSRA